jgi:HTH-type transcriptional regulator/antitoxin HigA
VINSAAILNEREARDAKATLAEIGRALSSELVLESIVAGLPPEVVNGYRRALASQRADLQAHLNAYEAAKGGDYSELKRFAGNDPGVALIVARIARGYSQKDLARRLGLKEQQVQRYEVDRYRSISLSNYRRIAHVLGVRWDVKLSDGATPRLGSGWDFAADVTATDVKKVIKHAKEHNWFKDNASELAGEESHNYLQRYISDHILNYGSPTLLRTGLNIEHSVDDLLLIAWKSRVTRLAEPIIANRKIEYSGLGITWLCELVRLSTHEDGPARARDFLLNHGIVLVIEPQITGLKLDGAAFLVGNTPVVGMTLRRDAIDNFWFTILHELAHVLLHYRTGLS